MRLLAVLGASAALGDHLLPAPRALARADRPAARLDPPRGVRRARPACCGRSAPTRDAAAPVADAGRRARRVDALRVEYRRLLLRLAARDLAHDLGVDDAAAELSDLAAGTLEAALAIARAAGRREPPRCPARRDRDGQVRRPRAQLRLRRRRDLRRRARRRAPTSTPPLRAATQLASQPDADLLRAHRRGHDLAGRRHLRPEGKSGPLVRTLASHHGYYERWAKTWEFQALLKARPVAGDLALGREFVDVVAPMVWSAAERDGFVDATCRRCGAGSSSTSRPREAERQLKLGSGGLRDVEFAVQLLQLVHGRADERLRPPTTLSALAELTRGGYVGREDGEALHDGVPRSCAPSSTGSSSSSCAAPTWCRTTRRRCAGSAAAWASSRSPVERARRGVAARTAARSAGCTRSSSTARCSSAVARMPGRRGPALARGGRRAAGRARLRGPEGGAAPPRGADQRGVADREHPAHAAAGDARVVRRRPGPGRRAVRLPPDQRGARLDALVPQDAARRGAGRRAAGAGCWPPRRYATDLLRARAARACGCSATDARAAAPRRR